MYCILPSDLQSNLITDGLKNSQNKRMLWDYRPIVIYDPRLMEDQCVINGALFTQARLIWPVIVQQIQMQSLQGLFNKREAAK